MKSLNGLKISTSDLCSYDKSLPHLKSYFSFIKAPQQVYDAKIRNLEKVLVLSMRTRFEFMLNLRKRCFFHNFSLRKGGFFATFSLFICNSPIIKQFPYLRWNKSQLK